MDWLSDSSQEIAALWGTLRLSLAVCWLMGPFIVALSWTLVHPVIAVQNLETSDYSTSPSLYYMW